DYYCQVWDTNTVLF
nr:immunoglobulin light chain junction region [Macaca mulatta]MOW66409.1 immunoglobulin light chain junction region [Macaca mulatta]MOW66785.1 immunoglobulin light chain junction region [Macaca mulatta]MOW67602.1 immunoglobulin light chain junction region [Macaca mulatta]MOW67777.1 immunoglobulin light chain junction region [Macaca mulatta]